MRTFLTDNEKSDREILKRIVSSNDSFQDIIYHLFEPFTYLLNDNRYIGSIIEKKTVRAFLL